MTCLNTTSVLVSIVAALFALGPASPASAYWQWSSELAPGEGEDVFHPTLPVGGQVRNHFFAMGTVSFVARPIASAFQMLCYMPDDTIEMQIWPGQWILEPGAEHEMYGGCLTDDNDVGFVLSGRGGVSNRIEPI